MSSPFHCCRTQFSLGPGDYALSMTLDTVFGLHLNYFCVKYDIVVHNGLNHLLAWKPKNTFGNILGPSNRFQKNVLGVSNWTVTSFQLPWTDKKNFKPLKIVSYALHLDFSSCVYKFVVPRALCKNGFSRALVALLYCSMHCQSGEDVGDTCTSFNRTEWLW